MVSLVEQMLKSHKDLPKARTAPDKTAIERQIAATDKQLGSLVYGLCGLTGFVATTAGFSRCRRRLLLRHGEGMTDDEVRMTNARQPCSVSSLFSQWLCGRSGICAGQRKRKPQAPARTQNEQRQGHHHPGPLSAGNVSCMYRAPGTGLFRYGSMS